MEIAIQHRPPSCNAFPWASMVSLLHFATALGTLFALGIQCLHSMPCIAFISFGNQQYKAQGRRYTVSSVYSAATELAALCASCSTTNLSGFRALTGTSSSLEVHVALISPRSASPKDKFLCDYQCERTAGSFSLAGSCRPVLAAQPWSLLAG